VLLVHNCHLSHLLVWKVYCGKTADWIGVQLVSGVGRGIGVLDRGPHASGMGVSGGVAPRFEWRIF